jgi:hypothetical protein
MLSLAGKEDSKHDQHEGRYAYQLAATLDLDAHVPQHKLCEVCRCHKMDKDSVHINHHRMHLKLTRCPWFESGDSLSCHAMVNVMFMHRSQLAATTTTLHTVLLFLTKRNPDQSRTDVGVKMEQARSGVLVDDLLQFANGLQVCATVPTYAIYVSI